MRSRIAFDYVDPSLPTLQVLRRQEGLDRLAEEAPDEFALIRSVMDHVKRQWDHSWHAPMQHVNALEVLEDVRSGLRGNFCVYFTHVLLQALWSLGVPCRYVHVAVHHWQSHSTSECWSNEHRKWITVDSDFNLHYVRAEGPGADVGPVRTFVPQNARDIQRAWRGGEMDHILPVQGPGGMPFDAKTRLGQYYGGVFGFVADYGSVLREGPPEWEGQCRHWYVWRDETESLPDYHLQQFRLTHGNGVCTPISDPEQYYWPVNEVVMEPPEPDCMDGEALPIEFETFTPFFSTFLVRRDGGAWVEHKARRIDGHRAVGSLQWELHDRRNVLEIRSRNVSERLGPVALVEIASPPCVPPENCGCWSVATAGSDLGGLAVHESRLYVARQWSGYVDVIQDGKVGSKIGTPCTVPPHPPRPPVEPRSEVVNVRRAAGAPAGHLLAPLACAVAPDGTLYVGDTENYRIQPFDPGGEALAPWGSHGTEEAQFLHIRAITAGPDGTVYVADSGYAGPVGLRTEHVSRVRRFDPHGTLICVIAGSGSAPGNVCSPAGLAVDRSGMLWVADSGNHRVQCFSPEGQLRACWGDLGDGWGELRFPTDVAPALGGFVFVADPQHHCVWKLTDEGRGLARLERGGNGEPLLRPGRLAVHGGTLYVGDVGSGAVHLYRI